MISFHQGFPINIRLIRIEICRQKGWSIGLWGSSFFRGRIIHIQANSSKTRPNSWFKTPSTKKEKSSSEFNFKPKIICSPSNRLAKDSWIRSSSRTLKQSFQVRNYISIFRRGSLFISLLIIMSNIRILLGGKELISNHQGVRIEGLLQRLHQKLG